MSHKHITSFERGEIQALLKLGKTKPRIAEQLNRPLCTIGREIARNSGRDGYRADKAQAKYAKRRLACVAPCKLDPGPLRDYVIKRIRHDEWSPEQVAGRLPLEYPDDPAMRISHEAIYQAVYTQQKLNFLIKDLAQARPKRRKRGQGKSRRGPSIPNRVGIDKRPEHIETREEVGHWEGDTVVGKGQDGFIVTLVERSSRLLHAIKTHTKNAAQVAQAIIGALIDRPISWVKTITFDNGTEFARHEEIAQVLPVDIYFADPYSSYQRGTNENTNGLIRRYLPKRTSFADLQQWRLDKIVEQLNNRPRKCLGYRTPNEVFQEQREKHLLAIRA